MHELSSPGQPSETLIGRSSDGRFKATKAKEYPPLLCLAVARAVLNFVGEASAAHHTVSTFEPTDIPGYSDTFAPLDPYLEVEMGRDYNVARRV